MRARTEAHMRRWLNARIVSLIVVALCISLYWRAGPHPLWQELLVLYFTTFILTALLLRIVRPSPTIAIFIPSYIHFYFSSSIAFIISALYYLRFGTTLIWKYTCALVLTGAACQLVVLAFFSIITTRCVRRLYRDFQQDHPPDFKPPYAIIHNVGAANDRFLKRAIFAMVQSLWRFRHLSPASFLHPPASLLQIIMSFEPELDREVERLQAKTVYSLVVPFKILFKSFIAARRFFGPVIRQFLSERLFLIFVTVRDLEGYPRAFRDYVATNAAACIGITLTGGQIAAAVLRRDSSRDDVLISEGGIQTLLPAAGLVGYGVRTLRDWAERKKREFTAAETQLRRHLHFCRGPSFILIPRRLPSAEEPDGSAAPSSRGYHVIQALRDNAVSFIPAITQVLGDCCMPLTRAEARLEARLRTVIAELAAQGFAPLADCYLRFRTSHSDVERFLCLLDCFEVLIKYSVIILATTQQGQVLPIQTLQEALERPSLGTWMSLLRSSVGSEVLRPTHLQSTVKTFWRQPLLAPARELIEAVNGSGLNWKGQVPRSHLGWLEWLTWLRNVTKGHGGVDERTVSPVWEKFHETFLQIVVELAPLTLESSVLVRDVEGSDVQMKGWMRGGVRSSGLFAEPVRFEDEYSAPELHQASDTFPLAPFMLFKRTACLTWNSRKDPSVEYVDYCSGQLESVRAEVIPKLLPR